jgi:hypothetical protein
MRYGMCIKQRGGCDHTIGCGRKMVGLDAATWDEAVLEAGEIIGEEYDFSVYEVEIIEIAYHAVFSAKDLAAKAREAAYQARRNQERANDEAELARLAAKLGKTVA